MNPPVTAEKVAVTNGCFDPVTGAHVRFLRCASALASAFGGSLTVFVASDRHTVRLKGPGRPILPLEHRVEILSALRSVDRVWAYDSEDQLRDHYAQLRPAVLFKGEEWRGHSLTGQEYAQETIFLPSYPGHASEFLAAYASARDRAFGSWPHDNGRVVTKAWGEEWWWSPDSARGYLAKLMRVFPGRQSSLHRHGEKDETFLVLTGSLRIWTGTHPTTPLAARDISRGGVVWISPGLWHIFANPSDHIVEFVEAGTAHSDVERMTPSGSYVPEAWA